ncbi:MAG: hypothetical protein MRY21_05595 [Simkaniaceae bacterium]|nr:hypothetical protein [Simkaniaceae bacterium]
MSDEVAGVSGPSLDAAKLRAQQKGNIREEKQITAEQRDIKALMDDPISRAMFNPLEMGKKFKTLDERLKRTSKQEATQKKEQSSIKDGKDVQKAALAAHEKTHKELNQETIKIIRNAVKENDTADEILAKVQKAVPDAWLSDETLDFLLQTTSEGSEHYETIKRAKEQFNNNFDREIKAGRNMARQSIDFSKQGLSDSTSLRDLYRSITGNPRQPQQLFTELMSKFEFKKMKEVIEFVLSSLGADMKAKGPSIPRGELQNMFSEARSMQSIMGVFRFFNGRMNMIKGQFKREDLVMPPRLNFELLAEQFMKLIAERYPSPDKVLRMAQLLGISEELLAQIIIFTQYRDAMRQVSPRLFRSERQRQDLLSTILDALSELDDVLEKEEDEDEDEEDDYPPPRRTRDTMESME